MGAPGANRAVLGSLEAREFSICHQIISAKNYSKLVHLPQRHDSAALWVPGSLGPGKGLEASYEVAVASLGYLQPEGLGCNGSPQGPSRSGIASL
jgi:hypothetical protein